jgi:hypothetical protein
MKPKSTGLTDNTVEPNAVNSIARRPGSPGSFGAVNGAYYQVNQASYEGLRRTLAVWVAAEQRLSKCRLLRVDRR